MTEQQDRRDGEIRGTGIFLKGDCHVHPDRTNDPENLPKVVEWYRQRGYNFIAMTEHRRLVPTAGLSDGSFVVVPGMELNAVDPELGDFHMLGIGLTNLVEQPAQFTAREAVALIREDGGLPFMAHPGTFDQTAQTLLSLPGLCGLEVFNRSVHHKMGKGVASELWSQVLGHGQHLWGLADSDNHFPPAFETGHSTQYNVVEVSRRDPAAVLEALRHGWYYASTGPEITSYHLDADGVLHVTCSPATTITVLADRNKGTVYRAAPGKVLTSIRHQLTGRRGPVLFARVEVADGQGGMAWTNPLYPA